LEMSAKRRSLVGPEGASSAGRVGALAGAAVSHATAAKPIHNRTLPRTAMGFIRLLS
jgi:hypothetical protein